MPENRSENQQQPKDQIDLAKWIGNMTPRETMLGAAAFGEFVAHAGNMGETARIVLFGAALVGNEVLKAKEQNVDFTSGTEVAKFVGREILDLKNFAWFAAALAASVPETLPIVGGAIEGTVNFFKSHPKVGEAIVTALIGTAGIVGAVGATAGVAVGIHREVWAKNLGPAIERTRKTSSDFFTALKDKRVKFQFPATLRSPIREILPPKAPEPITGTPLARRYNKNRTNN